MIPLTTVRQSKEPHRGMIVRPEGRSVARGQRAQKGAPGAIFGIGGAVSAGSAHVAAAEAGSGGRVTGGGGRWTLFLDGSAR